MESVLAGRATLVRCLHVGRNDRVTDRTFALTLQGALDVAAEGEQPIDQVTIGEHDNTLDRQQPALPLLLIHKHSTTADNQSRMQGIGGR